MKFACKNIISNKIVFCFEAKNWYAAEKYYYDIVNSVITSETEDEQVMTLQGQRAFKYNLISIE